MYNPNRVSLLKDTKTLKQIKHIRKHTKMNKPKVRFPSKGAPKPYAHKHLHKLTHTPKCTNPTRVCLPSKKHQNPKHTYKHLHKMHKPKQSFPSKCATIQN